ncbi:MAG: DUF6913 domain-containing protein [Dysgonomonas sp.]
MFDFLVKWKIDSAFKSNKRDHAFRNIESIESILILFSYNDWKEIEIIARDLESKKKKVVMWTVQPPQKNLGNTIFPSNVRIIHPNEISLLNVISSSVLNEFKLLDYDTLIDLTTRDNKVCKYLLANNSSDCSIGISQSEYNVYDFIVLKEDNKTLQETYNQIKFYLNNIR